MKKALVVLSVFIVLAIIAAFIWPGMLPGVPDPTSEHWSDFSTSFWAATYSGILYSIFTGIIVGLVLWISQTSIEERRLKQQYQAEAFRFYQEAKRIHAQTFFLTLDNLASMLPGSAKNLVALYKEHETSVWLWQHAIHGLKPYLSAFEELIEHYQAAIEVGNRLHVAIGNIIRLQNASEHVDRYNDRIAFAYTLGRINMMSDTMIYAALNIHNVPPPWLDKAYEAVMSDNDVQSLITEFQSERDTLNEVLSTISNFEFPE
jgi:hypothetical protein